MGMDRYGANIGTSYSSQYQLVLDRAQTDGDTLPDAAQRIKGDALMRTIVNSGFISEADILLIMANNGSSGFGNINWTNPANFKAAYVNAVTFTPNKGARPNGTDSYVETNFNPTTNGVHYTLNNAGRILHVSTAPTTGNRMEGFKTSISCRSLYLNSTLHTINGGTIAATQDLTGLTTKAIFRSSSTNVKFFNGTTETDTTATSTGLANETFVLGRSSTVYSNTEISMYALTSNQAAGYLAFRTAWLTYFNNL
jgi:hypothetical protein